MDANRSPSTAAALEAAVLAVLPNAAVEVSTGSPGHYSLIVRSETFRGRSMLESHRLVYAAIASLMAGDTAPVHAIDSLKTIAG
jgi:acid stress-induced BolA-like protein IbaG/YrbA